MGFSDAIEAVTAGAGEVVRGETVAPVGSPETHPAGVPHDAFRKLMGSFPTGVSVVTTVFGEAPIGFTASSVASVSLDPPLLLVCAANRLQTLAAIREVGCFAINFLGSSSQETALRFASRLQNKFEGIDYRLGYHGVPLLVEAIGTAECAVHDIREVGDHMVIFGRIMSARSDAEQLPLIYFRGQFFGNIGN